jgi:hypothetical protein
MIIEKQVLAHECAWVRAGQWPQRSKAYMKPWALRFLFSSLTHPHTQTMFLPLHTILLVKAALPWTEIECVQLHSTPRRMVEQRQLAERARVAGNTAFAAGQFSEALRCYQSGLECEKTNMALHANAAQAALRLACHVQAVEHCDKVRSRALACMRVCACVCVEERWKRCGAHATLCKPACLQAAEIAKGCLGFFRCTSATACILVS